MELNYPLSTRFCIQSTHTPLGSDLLESAYQACLVYELRKKGLSEEVEKTLPLIYEEVKLDCGYRIDILVGYKVVVELKTVEAFIDVHTERFKLPEIIRKQSWVTS